MKNIDKHDDRWDWVPQRQGLRFVVVNEQTGEIVNDANGYGYKTEQKCRAWIRMMQLQVGIDTSLMPQRPTRDQQAIDDAIRLLKSKGYTITPPKK